MLSISINQENMTFVLNKAHKVPLNIFSRDIQHNCASVYLTSIFTKMKLRRYHPQTFIFSTLKKQKQINTFKQIFLFFLPLSHIFMQLSYFLI